MNISDISLIFYYNKTNRYSINALLGALEINDLLDDLKIYFCDNYESISIRVSELEYSTKKIIIGFSFCTTQLWEIELTIRQLRNRFGNKLVLVAGGPHATGDPKGTLLLGFNIVVKGEGEITFPELLIHIVKEESIENTKGICFLDNEGKLFYTGKNTWVDIDDYPPFSITKQKFGHIEITRGCPFTCYYCQTPFLTSNQPKHRSLDKILNYVYELKKINLTDIRFITPNAFSYGSADGKTLNLAALEELLKSVRKTLSPKGKIFFGSFPSEVRPEHVTPETIALVQKYANNDNLIIGAQTGSPRLLNLCHRGHTIDDVYRAVDLARKSGMKANVDFIFGLPGETIEDVVKTLNTIQDFVEMGARIHTHTFMPLPQTPFAKYPAGKVDNFIRKRIINLSKNGIAYGDWEEQEIMAKKIADYLSNGIFTPL